MRLLLPFFMMFLIDMVSHMNIRTLLRCNGFLPQSSQRTQRVAISK